MQQQNVHCVAEQSSSAKKELATDEKAVRQMQAVDTVRPVAEGLHTYFTPGC